MITRRPIDRTDAPSEAAAQPEETSRGPWGWLRLVLTWTVILLAVAILAASVLTPRVAGATPYSILTSSMSPDRPAGTLVVVRPTDPAEIGVGDVITYQLKSGEATVVTHRVVSQGIGDDGEPIFQTQGDANPSPDQAWVKPVQIKGKLWYSVPKLGYLNQLFTGSQRQWAITVIAALLLGYAAAQFIGAVRSRRARRTRAGRAARSGTHAADRAAG